MRDAISRLASATLLSLLWLPAAAAAAEAEPEALAAGFVRAWNAHDMKAFGALFTEDADFVNVGTTWWKGRAEIQAAHEKTHAAHFKTSALTAIETTVRRVAPGVAVVHLRWELTGALIPRTQEPAPVRRGHMQIVGVKRADGWAIASAQNTNASEPRP